MKTTVRRFLKYRLITYFMVVLTLFLTGTTLSQCTTHPPSNTEETPAVIARKSRLKQDIDFLSKDCCPRANDFPANQIKARDYLKKELEKCVKDVSLQAFDVEKRTYWNIHAVIPGKNPERLIVGAHYDSCGLTPGADDNASGVAGVLELARMLKNSQPEYTIELVLYTNEEPPWFGTENMGSAHHVKQLSQASIPVKAMICLEMIGYFDESDDSQNYPLPGMDLLYPSRGNFIAIVGNLNSISLAKSVQKGLEPYISTVRLNSPATGGRTGLDFSDHRNFWEAGHSSVMVTDTAHYRNHHYHELTDISDTLNYSKMASLVQGLYEAVARLGKISPSSNNPQK